MKIKIENIIGCLILLVFISTPGVTLAQNVMHQLKNRKETTHFAEALENSNLDKQLSQAGPYTLFVPSNEAFDKLSNGQKADSNLLLNHIFTGMATERSLKAMSNITCLSGRTISIHENKKHLTVDSFVIVAANIKADNGVIHIINGVIK